MIPSVRFIDSEGLHQSHIHDFRSYFLHFFLLANEQISQRRMYLLDNLRAASVGFSITRQVYDA
jgi:hypothetical protein